MRQVIGGSLFIITGALAGAGSAMTLTEYLGTEPALAGSPWASRDTSPLSPAHPYVVAHFLNEGRLPPAAGLWREYAADQSDDGSTLSIACTYTLTAKLPTHRWWSIAAESSGRGERPSNSVITSDTVVAEPNGMVTLTISREAVAGNWLKPPPTGTFGLIYTIAGPESEQAPAPAAMFTIKRRDC
ncbi:MAG: DUF1214 domain-containing protein [Alphaproteobacteria bacterium]|nr:DUF1214 domain-containing protein [Alphaproteobacteria bacterium]